MIMIILNTEEKEIYLIYLIYQLMKIIINQ